MEEFICPRAYESGLAYNGGRAQWREDDTCSYCGSLNPAVLLERVEAGTVELGPTDKNYKVYVHNAGGEPFRQTFRDCPRDRTCTGPDDCTHWTTREVGQTKAYFQHFNAAQCGQLIELLNAGKVKVGYPGHFYVLPFFMCRVAPNRDAAAA